MKFNIICNPTGEWPPFPVRTSFNNSIEDCLDSAGDLFEESESLIKYTREELKEMQDSD